MHDINTNNTAPNNDLHDRHKNRLSSQIIKERIDWIGASPQEYLPYQHGSVVDYRGCNG